MLQLTVKTSEDEHAVGQQWLMVARVVIGICISKYYEFNDCSDNGIGQ